MLLNTQPGFYKGRWRPVCWITAGDDSVRVAKGPKGEDRHYGAGRGGVSKRGGLTMVRQGIRLEASSGKCFTLPVVPIFFSVNTELTRFRFTRFMPLVILRINACPCDGSQCFSSISGTTEGQ